MCQETGPTFLKRRCSERKVSTVDDLEIALNVVDISAQAPPANQQILEQLEAHPDRAIMLRDQVIFNRSVSYLNRLMKDLSIHKCNSCAFYGEDLSDLRKHITDEKYQYGQEKLRKEKSKTWSIG